MIEDSLGTYPEAKVCFLIGEPDVRGAAEVRIEVP